MKKTKFNIEINADRQKVWNALWADETYPLWTAVFAAGSKAETDWQQGSSVLFTDGTGNGMISRIAEKRENEYMSIDHLGMIKDGIEIMEGPEVEGWAGAKENYTLTEKDGVTHLLIEMDSTAEMEDYFQKTWPTALEKLKELAEK